MSLVSLRKSHLFQSSSLGNTNVPSLQRLFYSAPSPPPRARVHTVTAVPVLSIHRSWFSMYSSARVHSRERWSTVVSWTNFTNTEHADKDLINSGLDRPTHQQSGRCHRYHDRSTDYRSSGAALRTQSVLEEIVLSPSHNSYFSGKWKHERTVKLETLPNSCIGSVMTAIDNFDS